MKTYQVPCIYSGIHRSSKDFAIKTAVPGSKSITNRALLLATLAEGESILRGALFSEDRTVRVTGMGGRIPKEEASVYVGSAGTAARFLTAFLGMGGGRYHMDSSPQMKKRPMGSLLDSLRTLGATVEFEAEKDHFPFTISGNCIDAYTVTVDVGQSSQFLSALLISACRTGKEMTVRVEGDHGMAYVDMTVRMMEQFGMAVRKDGDRIYRIEAGASYRPRDYYIEPDVSAACYFYAMCPILGIPVTVEGVRKDSMQGDLQFLNILQNMGCGLLEKEEGPCFLQRIAGIKA